MQLTDWAGYNVPGTQKGTKWYRNTVEGPALPKAGVG